MLYSVNLKMIASYELERMRKEAVVAYFKVLSQAFA
jgi:hypothetical protein